MERLNIQRRHSSGDKCECAGCTGKLGVGASFVNEKEQVRTQYLYCEICNWAPPDNKVVIPLQYAPPRKT